MAVARNVGLWVLLAGSTLSTLPVFSAFLPVDLGIAPRLEPMPAVLHLAASICAIGIVLVFLGNRDTTSRVLAHPMVLAALFVAVWSALISPFVDYPLLSFLGASVFGEAIVRYASLAVFFAAALILAGDRGAFRVLCLVLSLVSFIAPIVMYVLGQDFFVSLDLVGQFAISGAIAAWLMFPGCRLVVRLLLALGAAGPALALSSNHSVIAFMVLVGLPTAIAAYVLVRRRPDWLGLIRAIVLAGVLAAPLIGILLKWLMPELIGLPSIQSRHLLDKVLLAALQANPEILAFGQGWGAINLTADSYILSANAVMWDGSWDLASRNISHSHSVFGEALFGAGLPAVAGVVMMMAAPLIVTGKAGLPLAVFASVTMAGLSSVSAEFPSTVGAVALAFALAARAPDGEVDATEVPVAGRVVALAMPVLAGGLFVAAGWAFHNGNEIRLRTADVYERGTQSPFRCLVQPNPALYGDIDLARGLIMSYRPVFQKAKEGEAISPNELQLLDAYYCQADRRVETSQSSSLQIALESFRVDVALDQIPVPVRERYAHALGKWPEKIAQALNKAPQRVDLSLGFLVSQLEMGNLRTVESLAGALLERDPEDPIAMWFLGLMKVRSADRRVQLDGWRLLRNSLDAGITRFFDIPDHTIREVRASVYLTQ